MASSNLKRHNRKAPGLSELALQTNFARFTDFKYLGSFATSDGVNFVDATEGENMPGVVNLNRLRRLERPLSIDLKDGFYASLVNSSYGDLRKHKYRYYIEWLQEKQLIPQTGANCSSTPAPDFVVTNGAMVDLMSFSYKTKHNPVYAMKRDGVIYLSSKASFDFEARKEPVAVKQSDQKDCPIAQFTHLKFVKFVLGDDDISDIDKFYAVHEFMFGSKRILIMSEVRAMEPKMAECDPKFVEVKSLKRKFSSTSRDVRWAGQKWLQQKYFHLWLQCVLANKQTIINGIRAENILEEVEVLSLQEVQTRSHTEESVYFSFLERALNMIIENVREEGARVYEFGKFGGIETVRPFREHGKCFLPDGNKAGQK